MLFNKEILLIMVTDKKSLFINAINGVFQRRSYFFATSI